METGEEEKMLLELVVVVGGAGGAGGAGGGWWRRRGGDMEGKRRAVSLRNEPDKRKGLGRWAQGTSSTLLN